MLVDQAQVHVGEQLELAADHLREIAVAEHGGDLRRGQAPPQPAGGAAQDQRRAAGHHPGADRGARVHLPGRSLRQDQREQRDPGRGPGGDRRQLVDGQVANRDVVAVIEPDQLRDHHPDGQQHERPESVRGGRGDDDAGGRGGDQISQREHAAAQGVAPETRPTRLVLTAPFGADGRGAFPDHLGEVNPPKAQKARKRTAWHLLPTPAREPSTLLLARERPANQSAAELPAFLICVEHGRLESEAILLVESLRAWGGACAESPVYAFAPRPEFQPDGRRRSSD